MKKTLLSLVCMLIASFTLSAAEVSITTNASASTWTGGDDGYSTTTNGFTLGYEKNTSSTAARTPDADHIRVYKNYNFRIKSTAGETINKIVFHTVTNDKKYTADMSVSDGSTAVADQAAYTITWTGSTKEWLAEAAAAQVRFTSIDITYGGGDVVTVEAPVISPNGGTITQATTVTITAPTAGSTIHYTTDGTNPNSGSDVYSSALTIDKSTTLKAIAIKDAVSSTVTTAIFTLSIPGGDSQNIPTNSEASTWTGDANGYTTTTQGFTISYLVNTSSTPLVAPSADHIRVYKNAMLKIAKTDGATIKKVVLNTVLASHAVNMTVNGSEIATGNGDTKTVTWEGSTTEWTAVADVAQVRVMSIDVTFEAGTTSVIAPSFSVEGGTYFEPFDVEITTPTAGAAIYYTTDGTTPSATSKLYASPVLIDEPTTLKAIAIKDGQSSSVKEATYAFSSGVANIAGFLALADNASTRINGAVTAVYQNGAYLYVKDDSGVMLVYGSVNQTYNNGDVIPSGIMGKKTTYNNLIEFIPEADTFNAGTAGTPVAPQTIGITDATAALVNTYVVIKNVKVTADGLSDGTNTLALYKRFSDVTIPEAGETLYDVKGLVSIYKETIQLFPTEFGAASGVNDVTAATAKVVAVNGQIEVVGEANNVAVYNTAGSLISKAATTSVAPGVYIVNVDGVVTKLVVR